MNAVWQRIRQRKLVQWGLAYLAGAWLILQVLSLLAQPFAWPTLVIKATTVLLGIGFFAVLVLAWYHGERGVQRATPIELMMLTGILIVAAVAVRLVATPASEPQTVRAITSDGSASIAVLPFTNLARSTETEPFVDGVHDDLLTLLSRVDSLRVIPRTSVQEYRNTTKRIPQIASELGVQHVIQGGVQRVGDQVRINVQLIDARADRPIWSDSYDHTLTMANVFAIQTEIAQAIAGALEMQLSPADRENMAERPTENVEAYDAYLRARALQARAEAAGKDWRAAADAFQRSVEIDPDFALAWAKLSFTHAQTYWFHEDRSEERLRLAREAGDRALRLNPNLADVHIADGFYWYWGFRDYEKALAAFEKARALDPKNSDIDNALAVIYRRQGRYQESADHFRRYTVANPREAHKFRELACTLIPLGGLAEAEQAARRAVVLAPDGIGNQLFLMWVLYAQERVTEAQASLVEGIRTIGAERMATDIADQAWSRWLVLADTTTWRALERVPISSEVADTGTFYVVRAEWLKHRGNVSGSRAAADSARPFLERRARAAGTDWWFGTQLALSHALAGRADAARAASSQALATLRRAPDAWDEHFAALHNARVTMLLGDRDKTIAHLTTALKQPSPLPPAMVRVDARFASLRGDPRYEALVQPIKR